MEIMCLGSPLTAWGDVDIWVILINRIHRPTRTTISLAVHCHGRPFTLVKIREYLDGNDDLLTMTAATHKSWGCMSLHQGERPEVRK